MYFIWECCEYLSCFMLRRNINCWNCRFHNCWQDENIFHGAEHSRTASQPFPWSAWARISTALCHVPIVTLIDGQGVGPPGGRAPLTFFGTLALGSRSFLPEDILFSTSRYPSSVILLRSSQPLRYDCNRSSIALFASVGISSVYWFKYVWNMSLFCS